MPSAASCAGARPWPSKASARSFAPPPRPQLDTPELYELAEGSIPIVEGLEPTADRATLERVVGALEVLHDRVHAFYRTLVEARIRIGNGRNAQQF